jgi:acyl-CoA thioesterase I
MLRRFRDTPLPAACIRVLGGVLLLLALASCGAPKVDALGPGSRVLALGDSLTYGTGATPETSYPAALAAMTKWTVVNAGVPGEVAQQGCARLGPLIAEHRPELILVFLGGNDILRRGSIQALNEGLAHCAEVAHGAKVPMVLFAVPRFELAGFADSPIFANVAKSSKVDFLSPQLGKLLSNEKLRADQVHLNADGYRALAGNVAEELRRLGYLRR